MAVNKFTDGRKGWYFQFYFNGKKIKKEKWKGNRMINKADAIAAEAECKQELQAEYDRQIGKMTLYELWDDYVAKSKSNLKDASFQRYNIFKNNHLNLIEDKDIWELTPNDIFTWKEKICNRKDLTTVYKNRIIQFMLNCLKYGQQIYDLKGRLQLPLLEQVKDDKIKDNTSVKEKYLPPEKFKILVQPLLDIENENNFYYYVILNSLYWSGLRIGELAALQVKDYKKNAFNVFKGYIRVNGKDIIQTTKTSNSVRIVPLDASLCSLLNDYIVKYNKKPNDILFHLESKYLNEQRLRRVLKQCSQITNLDLNYDIHLHSLRHSHASYLRKELNLDEFLISKRLGNTPQVSAQTYIHTTDAEMLEIASKINKK